MCVEASLHQLGHETQHDLLYKECDTLKQNRTKSYIGFIFCGLQHFDQVIEMDVVLEFVSPNIPMWNALIENKSILH